MQQFIQKTNTYTEIGNNSEQDELDQELQAATESILNATFKDDEVFI